MNVTQKLKNIEPNLSKQQSQQLFNLYQEIMDMTQELKQLQQNNQHLQKNLSEKKCLSNLEKN